MVKSEKTYKTKWHYRLYKIIFWISIFVSISTFIFSTFLFIKEYTNNEIIFFKPNIDISWKNYFNNNDSSYNKNLWMHLFAEESNAYKKMKVDNLQDKEIKEAIKWYRAEKLIEFWLNDNNINFNSIGVIDYMNKWISLEKTLTLFNNIIFSNNFMEIIINKMMLYFVLISIIINLFIWWIYRGLIYVIYDE